MLSLGSSSSSRQKIIKFVSDETKKAVSAALPPMREQFSTERDVICYNAPVLIFICTPNDKQWGDVHLADSILAAQNMFLKAYDLGLGSCYMGFVNFLSESVLRKAGVPEGYTLRVPLIIGHRRRSRVRDEGISLISRGSSSFLCFFIILS